MANSYKNPIIFDTAPYQTGTLTATQGSQTITGSGTTWTTTTHPTSQTAVNRDRVTEISIDTGTTWYVVKSRDTNTQLTLEIPFAEATSAGASYLTRVRVIPLVKLASVTWVGATANNSLIIRDAGYNVKVEMKAVTAYDQWSPATDFWCHGLALSAIGSGTAYVYLE